MLIDKSFLPSLKVPACSPSSESASETCPLWILELGNAVTDLSLTQQMRSLGRITDIQGTVSARVNFPNPPLHVAPEDLWVNSESTQEEDSSCVKSVNSSQGGF